MKKTLTLSAAQQTLFTDMLRQAARDVAEVDDMDAVEYQELKAAAAKGLSAERGSERGARTLKEDTAALTSLLTAAVKAIGFERPDCWRGEKFLRKAACQQLLEELPDEVLRIWNARRVEGSLSTVLLRTKALAGWTRTDCDREKLEKLETVTDPDRRRYLMEREKSRSKTAGLKPPTG